MTVLIKHTTLTVLFNSPAHLSTHPHFFTVCSIPIQLNKHKALSLAVNVYLEKPGLFFNVSFKGHTKERSFKRLKALLLEIPGSFTVVSGIYTVISEKEHRFFGEYRLFLQKYRLFLHISAIFLQIYCYFREYTGNTGNIPSINGDYSPFTVIYRRYTANTGISADIPGI